MFGISRTSSKLTDEFGTINMSSTSLYRRIIWYINHKHRHFNLRVSLVGWPTTLALAVPAAIAIIPPAINNRFIAIVKEQQPGMLLDSGLGMRNQRA
jgi:hypothetical protein